MPIMTRYTHDRAVIAMNWRGAWVAGDYTKDDLVRDGSWTMIANKDTGDRPAPQKIGAELSLYNGLSPTVSDTAKQVVSGIDMVAGTKGFWFNGYEVYVVADNHYRVYAVDSSGAIVELLDFSASSTGWLSFSFESMPVSPGGALAIIQVVSEPAASPTVWTGDWNYDTPNNATNPTSGEITHANRLLDTLRIHKVDDNGTNRGAELLALVAGDIIDAVGMRWTIQSITDEGLYVSIGVAPSQQGSPEGVSTFSFETVLATPITIMADPDYWLINQPSGGAVIKGLFSLDGDPIVENNNAYGINPVMQEAYVSPDWDPVASITGASSDGSSSIAGTESIPTVGYTGNVSVGQGHNRKTFHIENGLVKDVT